MDKPATWLLDHARDVYSQSGEDGIIETILELLPHQDQWCVEFGAWDGLFASNTRHLIETKDYSAVLIEADAERFRDLQRNHAKRNNVFPVNAHVGFGADDNLDRILGSTSVPVDFDVLSIDIDGNDFHVWKALSIYVPKVVVIEFNPTIPTEVSFVQPPDPSVNQGSSLSSLVQLGKQKGYELVSVLPFNAFFVRREYYPLFQIDSNAPEVLRTNLDAITYLFSGYDGRVFLRGNLSLLQFGVALRESKFQPLPKLFRKYPGTYSKGLKGLFALYLIYADPEELGRRIRRHVGSRRNKDEALPQQPPATERTASEI